MQNYNQPEAQRTKDLRFSVMHDCDMSAQGKSMIHDNADLNHS